jgi:hypothetical protein
VTELPIRGGGICTFARRGSLVSAGVAPRGRWLRFAGHDDPIDGARDAVAGSGDLFLGGATIFFPRAGSAAGGQSDFWSRRLLRRIGGLIFGRAGCFNECRPRSPAPRPASTSGAREPAESEARISVAAPTTTGLGTPLSEFEAATTMDRALTATTQAGTAAMEAPEALKQGKPRGTLGAAPSMVAPRRLDRRQEAPNRTARASASASNPLDPTRDSLDWGTDGSARRADALEAAPRGPREAHFMSVTQALSR